MNEWQKKLKEALKTVERKRLNVFNTQIIPGLELKVEENICSQYLRADLTDISYPYPTNIFQSYLYVHKEDILVWVMSELKLLLSDSMFMESIGYKQRRHAFFKRDLNDTHYILVQRNTNQGFSNISVELREHDPDIFKLHDDILDHLNHVGDIKTPVIKMERKCMEFSSFHLMNNNLRDLLILN